MLLTAGCVRVPEPVPEPARRRAATATAVLGTVTGSDCTDDCKVPTDIVAFIDARNACDHWRGESWPEVGDDPEGIRKKQIFDGIRSSCTGTDKHLSALKATYANDPHVMQLLGEYDPDIEPDD